MKNSEKNTLKAIDLYSGIGGWSLGFKMAGVDICTSYEWWEHQGRARLGWHEGASDAVTPIYTDCVPQD